MSWKELAKNEGNAEFKKDETTWYGSRVFKVPQDTEEVFLVMLDSKWKDKFQEATGWEKPIKVWQHYFTKEGDKYSTYHACSKFTYFCPYCYLNEICDDPRKKPYPQKGYFIAPVVRQKDGEAGYFFFKADVLETMGELEDEPNFKGCVKVKLRGGGQNGFAKYTAREVPPFEYRPTKAHIKIWDFKLFMENCLKGMILAQKAMGDTINGNTVDEWHEIALADQSVNIGSWGDLAPSLDGNTKPVKKAKTVPPKDKPAKKITAQETKEAEGSANTRKDFSEANDDAEDEDAFDF